MLLRLVYFVAKFAFRVKYTLKRNANFATKINLMYLIL